MKELAAEVEKGEEGCLSYAVFASPVDNTIIVFERCVGFLEKSVDGNCSPDEIATDLLKDTRISRPYRITRTPPTSWKP
jgi:hypothetical protein